MKNYLKSLIGAVLLLSMAFTATAQAPLQYRVDNIQSLLNITLYGADAKVTAWVGGGTARDDGDGGVFFYDGNSAVSTNVYAVYKPLNNAGRWWKLPTSVAYQTTAVTVGTDTTYAWKLLRGGQTNFFGIGADNTTAYLQTFNGKTLQINNLGNNTILNATAGNVGIGTTGPTYRFEVVNVAKASVDNALFGLSTTDAANKFELAFSRSAAGAGSYYSIQSIESGIAYRNLVLQASGGNVGIGTTAPTSLLSVNGAAGLSSLVVTNGTTMGSLTVTNNLIVGDAPVGNAIRAIYSAAAELDFPNILATSVTNLTVTVTGAGTNSVASVSSANGTVATANGLTFSAWVSATNTVTVRAANGTLDAWNPASSSYRVVVMQY